MPTYLICRFDSDTEHRVGDGAGLTPLAYYSSEDQLSAQEALAEMREDLPGGPLVMFREIGHMDEHGKMLKARK